MRLKLSLVMKEIEMGSNIREDLVNKWLNGFRCKVALHPKEQ